MEIGAILDSQIIASSMFSNNHAPYHARLHFKATALTRGSWSAGTSDMNQWLQVDLLQTTEVTCIATQGRNKVQQWVTKYKLQYSEDEHTFKFYKKNGDHLDTVEIQFTLFLL